MGGALATRGGSATSASRQDAGPLRVDEIEAARARIAPFVVQTPLLPFPGVDNLWLKAENLQATGSFKVRGAASRLTALVSQADPPHGVVTASSGNHGQAVAYMAVRLGLAAAVVVPEDVPEVKAEGIKRWGARVIRHGRTSEERLARAMQLQEEEGLEYVAPYDDRLVMAGQGTIGLEIVERLSGVRTVLVPVSGGGLISGVATALKGADPSITVIGVEPEAMPRFAQSVAAGRRVRVPFAATLADGLRVVEPGLVTWEAARVHVDQFTQVADGELLAAMRRLLVEAHLVVEPSGAATAAAAFALTLPGPVVAVLSGGNVEPALLRLVLS